MTKKRKKKPGAWIDVVASSVGKFIHLETHDGVFREGKLTGLRMREIHLNGEEVEMPIAVELNGDPSDYIDFGAIFRFDVDG
jgi:hypothetical protein